MQQRMQLFCTAILGCAMCFAQVSSPKLPPHVRLVPDLKAMPKQKPAPPQQLRQPRATVNVQQQPTRCGHIVVYGYRVAQTVDPKFTIPPPKPQSNMPVLPGLPVCPEDIR